MLKINVEKSSFSHFESYIFIRDIVS
uniref:Uncharacterized protein n=1 Tax=Nelumbo nucifera TaxID=4432 RepID=A0A822Z1M2_NELNU|nr:TPA_asm: hypothetical protein HUJ06_006038 [Nelumbo nucifera]